MKRLTISVDADLADAFDELMHRRGYQSRSEAFRALLRSDVEKVQVAHEPQGPCVATLSYLCEHNGGQQTSRLRQMRQEQHELIIATTHVHADEGHRLEAIMLRGHVEEVRAFAESVMALPGVLNGTLNLVPVQGGDASNPGQHAAAPLLM